MTASRNLYIPADDLGRIRAHLPSARDRLIFDLALATGFRIDDIMHLRVWQLRRSRLEVVEMKTGKVRTASLPRELHDRLISATEGRHPLRSAFPELRVFRGRHEHRSTVWRHFSTACKAAGLGGRGYTIHSLRKCYAVDLLRRTGSLSAVQADLGHASLSTTALYALSDRL